MTHLLIPIADMEETIKVLKNTSSKSANETANFLQIMLDNGKKISIDKEPRKLTKKEREIICGCSENGGCNDGQMWACCQCSKGELLTDRNKERLKDKKKKK